VPTAETTLTFLAAALLLGYTPGPDNLFVLMQSLAHGARAGMTVVLGLCTGLCVHTAAVALGLAAAVAGSPVAFAVLKSAGAAYLSWLAWQAWRAPPQVMRTGDGTGPALSARVLYGRGVVMNLSNPKVLLFFLALLPQFADPGRGPVAPQIVWFGAWFVVATVIAFGSIALSAGALAGRLTRSASAQRLLNRACALVFAALALRLLVSAA
jgi:threonine/homoserine/homoserine lactone efflux protein